MLSLEQDFSKRQLYLGEVRSYNINYILTNMVDLKLNSHENQNFPVKHFHFLF